MNRHTQPVPHANGESELLRNATKAVGTNAKVANSRNEVRTMKLSQLNRPFSKWSRILEDFRLEQLCFDDPVEHFMGVALIFNLAYRLEWAGSLG